MEGSVLMSPPHRLCGFTGTGQEAPSCLIGEGTELLREPVTCQGHQSPGAPPPNTLCRQKEQDVGFRAHLVLPSLPPARWVLLLELLGQQSTVFPRAFARAVPCASLPPDSPG